MNLPSHAVRNAVASSKAGNEEFPIGSIDRRRVAQSANKALDDASNVLQAGDATEVELIEVTGWLTCCDPQIKLLINLIARFQLFLFTKSLNQPRGEPPTLNMRTTSSTAEISLLSNLQTGWSSKGWVLQQPARQRRDHHPRPQEETHKGRKRTARDSLLQGPGGVGR